MIMTFYFIAIAKATLVSQPREEYTSQVKDYGYL